MDEIKIGEHKKIGYYIEQTFKNGDKYITPLQQNLEEAMVIMNILKERGIKTKLIKSVIQTTNSYEVCIL